MTRQRFQACSLLAALGFALTLVAQSAPAKDLGVRGAVWPVAEPDLLGQIEARLEELEASGEMALMRREAAERARRRIEAPARVDGIAAARVRRTRLFDPSITLDRDIRAADGTPIAARGARVNPLDGRPFTRDLLFIDGTRPVEVAWALGRGRTARIVLVAGRPLDLMRVHGRAFFFDQEGRLSKRLGLRATPSVVTAEGPVLRIIEVPLEDQADTASVEGRP